MSNEASNEHLLELSLEMLACAESSDWERLVDLEKARLPLFQQVFSQVVADNVALAKQVLSIDEKTMKLAAEGMPVLQSQLLAMRNSGKAKNAYQSIQNATSGNDS